MHILREQMYLLYKQVLNCWKQYLDMLSLVCTILISKYLGIFNVVLVNVPLF